MFTFPTNVGIYIFDSLSEISTLLLRHISQISDEILFSNVQKTQIQLFMSSTSDHHLIATTRCSILSIRS